MDFSAIVTDFGISSTIDIETRLCPDQYVGIVADVMGGAGIQLRRPISGRPDGRGVILVLESPHTAEFKHTTGPANGKSGLYLARFIGEVLGDGFSDCSLILMNAVQHQCSLGQPTHLYRDQIFSRVWSCGGRANFAERMKAAYRSGDVAVCCCTKGNIRDRRHHLRQMVYEAIRDSLPEATILKRTHPSGWNVRRNRSYVWT